MSELTNVEDNLARAFTMAEEIRETLRSGELMDTTELGALVQTTCLAAIKLPNDEAPKVRLRLTTLLDLLQTVKAEMVAVEQTGVAMPETTAG